MAHGGLLYKALLQVGASNLNLLTHFFFFLFSLQGDCDVNGKVGFRSFLASQMFYFFLLLVLKAVAYNKGQTTGAVAFKTWILSQGTLAGGCFYHEHYRRLPVFLDPSLLAESKRVA